MVNKVILIGRLGKDPETKNLESGLAVTSFSIATDMTWNDKNTGEKKQITEWHRIVTFSKLAEVCGQYLSKGKLVYVEGRLHTRSWEQDGVTRYITEVRANNMKILSTNEYDEKKDSEYPAKNTPPLPPDPGSFDDDIPF